MAAKNIIPILLNRIQAAALCNFSLRLLEYKTSSGEIPGFCKPFGTLARWDRKILERWVKDGCPDVREKLRNAPQTKIQAVTAETNSGK